MGRIGMSLRWDATKLKQSLFHQYLALDQSQNKSPKPKAGQFREVQCEPGRPLIFGKQLALWLPAITGVTASFEETRADP